MSEISDLLDEFTGEISDLYDFYLNGVYMNQNRHVQIRMQIDEVRRMDFDQNTQKAYLMSMRVAHTDNYATNAHERVLHRTPTLLAYKNSAKGGKHEVMLGSACVVSMYQMWEDSYRGKIASVMNMDKNMITHDFWGELRHLRRSIVHNSGKAVREMENNKILKSENHDAIISSNFNYINNIAKLAFSSIEEMKNQWAASH